VACCSIYSQSIAQHLLHAVLLATYLQGKVLTNGIKAIHADFQAAVERFQVGGWDN
jgi:hypothetical protein